MSRTFVRNVLWISLLPDMENSQMNLFVPIRCGHALRALRPEQQASLQASLTESFSSSLAYCVRVQNYIWEIFKVIVYCSVIKVLCCSSLQATTSICYYICHLLSTTFLFYFFTLSSDSVEMLPHYLSSCQPLSHFLFKISLIRLLSWATAI